MAVSKGAVFKSLAVSKGLLPRIPFPFTGGFQGGSFQDFLCGRFQGGGFQHFLFGRFQGGCFQDFGGFQGAASKNSCSFYRGVSKISFYWAVSKGAVSKISFVAVSKGAVSKILAVSKGLLLRIPVPGAVSKIFFVAVSKGAVSNIFLVAVSKRTVSKISLVAVSKGAVSKILAVSKGLLPRIPVPFAGRFSRGLFSRFSFVAVSKGGCFQHFLCGRFQGGCFQDFGGFQGAASKNSCSFYWAVSKEAVSKISFGFYILF